MTAAWLSSPAKRAFDVVVAAIALVVALPVLAVAALLVRVRMGRPVVLVQTRAGRDARPIRVLKLRTMTDERLPDGSLAPDEQRLTALGRCFRAASVDELPQLVNVLRGEMSIVGPRPLPMTYVDRYSEVQRRRLLARPGLTGLAQVRGRNALDWPERLALDVAYVESASLRLDLRILADSVRAVVSRRGVSAAGHATMHEFLGEG